jgi:hypothetical protein
VPAAILECFIALLPCFYEQGKRGAERHRHVGEPVALDRRLSGDGFLRLGDLFVDAAVDAA